MLQLLLWLSTPAIQIPPPMHAHPCYRLAAKEFHRKCGIALSRISYDESTTKPFLFFNK
jgi:hypothetical protein